MSTKKIQEVVALMDRSGSMSGKIPDSVGGFNSTLDVLRQELTDDSIINVSVKLFDNTEEMLIRSLPLEKVRPLETNQIIPRGQTALLDAMGNTLTFFMQKKLLNPKAYDYCTIYIVTDGFENCSKTFTREQIKEMVHSAEQNYNIKVIYLAANQDAILEASNLGIARERAINYSETPEETRAAYSSAAAMVGRHRSGASVEFRQAEREASQMYEDNLPRRVVSDSNHIRRDFNNPPPPAIVRQDSTRRVRSRN